MAIRLSDAAKKRSIESIQRYVGEELGEEIGILKAQLLLDFFLTEIGPSVYNGAIADAQARLQERVSELDGECYEPEFGYWS